MLTSRLAEVVHQSSDLTNRIKTLSSFLTTENAASQVQRMAARHPPNLRFIRKLAEGQTGSVHEVAAPGMPRNMAVKLMDWSTRDQRVHIAKVGNNGLTAATAAAGVALHPLWPCCSHTFHSHRTGLTVTLLLNAARGHGGVGAHIL